ncbi:DNA polymerase III subunit beta [Rossellomorea oryzaecorticis]|uniref:Beta sliding clamp n=1 Tax=Rossellomorea oryzaecorticis TaxID=1396505 RepID=A0ABU9K6T4_9BACI
MEFKINNDYFNKAISEVSKAVSSRTTLPILTGIKITADTEGLTLIGSNSDIVIERNLPSSSDGENMLEVFKKGSVVISAKYLSEITKKLPGDIYLKANENQSVVIQSDEIVTKLNGLNAEEYPSLPEVHLSNNYKMNSDDLIDMIKQTVFAASKSETRPVLTGVNFSIEESVLTCVATNSNRLALKKYQVETNLSGSFIVPGSSLIEFMRLFASYTTEIDIYATETNIVFKSNTISLYSRLIEGVYPNVSGLIPEQSSTVITLDTIQLLKGIDRASLFASEWRNNNISLQVTDQSRIKIYSKASEMGQIEETQYIKNISGDAELNITLDGNFMMDALKAIKEDEVKLCFNGSMRPILVLPVRNDFQLQLISPVRSY